MNGNLDIKQNDFYKSFQSVFDNQDLFAKIVDFFPYPIQVYALDGTSIMVNQALVKDYQIPSADMIVGKYNIFNDQEIAKRGLLEPIKRVFNGESICLTDIDVPIEDIVQRYGVVDYDVEALYQDITAFPIMDLHDKVAYVVAILMTKRLYRGKAEIIKGKEYIENHWQDKFSSDEVAKCAGLSKTHFTRLFKKHNGCTPHEYYINLKMSKIRCQLLDKTISITQAFALCGVDYNGHFAKLFKNKVGITPSEYQRMNE